MTKIALDTNIWIYLANSNADPLLVKLKEMKNNKEIEIIVSDINILEWNRNKTKKIRSLTNAIENEYKSALKLASYLDGKAQNEFLRTVSEYKDEKTRIAKAEQRVNEIEEFMKTCTIIYATDEQKLFIANLNIQKIPPFQSTKDNYNDALIIRSLCQYVDSNLPMKYDLIYVSNNPQDFIDQGTGQVYKCLFEGLEPIRLENVKELNHALNLAPELMDDFEEWLDWQLDNEAMRQLDLIRGK
jgi:predicted nucleic acid-binding protein